jgi:putative oxidoreductase
MTSPTDLVLLVGRLVFGGYFLQAGVNHFRHWRSLSQYAGAKGTPSPALAVLGTGGLLAAGGVSVATGVYPLVGLALLAVFLLGVTPVMHPFWKVPEPMARMTEQVNFTKNVALLGAVLALMALPQPWALSLGVGG